MSAGFAMLCEFEKEQGFKLVFPGDRVWLPKADWPDNIVISEAPFCVVRIVALYAKSPGQGAFSRMVTGICKAGYIPQVVCPMGPFMPAIVRKWGWHELVLTRETTWEPPLEWIAARKDLAA